MADRKSDKKSSNNKNTRSKKQPQEAEKSSNDGMSRIVNIVLVAISVVFFFITIIEGQGVWLFLHNVYVGVFGLFAACLFPLITILVCLLCFKQPNKKKFIVISIGTVLLILFLSSFIHIVRNQPGAEFVDTIVNSYKEATGTLNGGFFGAVFGWLFLTMGKAPAIIIDVVLIVVDILVITGLSVQQVFVQPQKKMYDKVAPVVQERREQRRERRMTEADINVPLDDYSPDDEDKSKRKKKRKSAPDVENDESKVPRDIIDEINAATERNRKERENAKTQSKKSLDEIVEKANSDTSSKPVEKLDVPKESLVSSVDNYTLPPVSLLNEVRKKTKGNSNIELKNNAQKLIDTLNSFGVRASITDISCGPTVTRYELKPDAGVRISKITNLSDDIALNLAATSVRIEAPIPGKAAVGIEVPNSASESVSIREMIDTPEFEKQTSLLSAGLGKDISGKCVFCDIDKMPHLLIAGTTGSGKSVCMNSIIVSILYRARPDQVKFLMIDPKKVEFSKYENIPHLLVPVVSDPRKAAGALGWAVSEMLQRYQTFSQTGVRDISGYNKYVKKHSDLEPMSQIVIFIDELADLMMAAPKEVEDSICRLAQMARAAGMHLVIATQRPSVDVITGLIKANISSRIALTVSSQIDSRTILDTGGAEKLLGRGDMLYNPIGASKPIRVQGCFISDEEVENLCEFIKQYGDSQYDADIEKEIEEKAVQEKGSSKFMDDNGGEKLDEKFSEAVETVIENGTASTSFLQRKLGVGYARGAKLIDQLEEKGIISGPNGSKPREVLINMQQWIEMKAYNGDIDFTADNMQQISFNETEFDDSDNSDVIVDNQ